MLAALVLLALAASPIAATSSCLQVEIAATGRSAHGSAIVPAAAPHLLILALDRLPAWVEDSPGIEAARITSLVAAPAVNVIPRRAVAVVDVSLDATLVDATLVDATLVDQDALIDELARALGSRVEVTLLPTGCQTQS